METEVGRYLHDVLGIAPELTRWQEVGTVPYFLQDAYDFWDLTLADQRILLAIERQGGQARLANIRGHMEKLRSLTGRPVVYVTHALASYQRKRLIADKVPFVVPGNQMYLPDLGIDLREHFRRPSGVTGAKLSPATQAILIAAMLQETSWERWAPAKLATQLGYSAMTASRAVQELTATGIAKANRSPGERSLHLERSKAETWEYAESMLRSPVKRRLWTTAVDRRPSNARVAGLSALSRLTSIVAPEVEIVATTKFVLDRGVEELPEPARGSIEWQIWRYSPALLTTGDTVDPLSLALSLRDTGDDRIQMALDELRAKFPW